MEKQMKCLQNFLPNEPENNRTFSVFCSVIVFLFKSYAKFQIHFWSFEMFLLNDRICLPAAIE